MQINEFLEETSKLEKFFNKNLEQYEKDIWYQELKNVPVNRYIQLIKQAYNTCKFMPKLADIVSINKELPYNTVKRESEKINCNKCNGAGLIEYFKKDEDRTYQYFARCTCKNGNKYIYDGTKISDEEHRSKFYVPSIAEINL